MLPGVSLAIKQDGSTPGYTFIQVILGLFYTPLICFWIYAQTNNYLKQETPQPLGNADKNAPTEPTVDHATSSRQSSSHEVI
jgi:hypothetical protein